MQKSKKLAPEMGVESTGWRGLPEVCTVKQLAENFRCSVSIIYQAIHSEEIEPWSGLIAWKENGRWITTRFEAARWFYAPFRLALTGLINATCGGVQ